MSHLFDYAANDMVVNYNLCVSRNFEKFLVKYLFAKTDTMLQNMIDSETIQYSTNNEQQKRSSKKQIKEFKRTYSKMIYDFAKSVFNKSEIIVKQLYSDLFDNYDLNELYDYILPSLNENDETHKNVVMTKEKTGNYLIAMAKMAIQIEKKNKKMHDPFPLRKSFIPHYVRFETAAFAQLFLNDPNFLAELQKLYLRDYPETIFPKKGRIKQFYSVSKFGYYMWKILFNLDLKIFKRPNAKQVFAYAMSTDGIGVSLQLIHKDDVTKYKMLKEMKTNAKNNITQNKKNMSEEEKIKYDEQRHTDKKQKKKDKIKDEINFKENIKKQNDQKKQKTKLLNDQFKLWKKNQNNLIQEKEQELQELQELKDNNNKGKITYINLEDNIFKLKESIKDDQDLIFIKKKELDEEKKNINNYFKGSEFKKVDYFSNEELKLLEKENKVYIDPGKRVILSMLGDNGKYYAYSRFQRDKDMKKDLYNKRELKMKNKNEIYMDSIEPVNMIALEGKIPQTSKSCIYENFIEYVRFKNEYFEEFSNFYNKKIFRQLKWYGYINKQRSEAKLVKNIIIQFGQNSKENRITRRRKKKKWKKKEKQKNPNKTINKGKQKPNKTKNKKKYKKKYKKRKIKLKKQKKKTLQRQLVRSKMKPTLIIGDWSGGNLKHTKPSANISLKRRIKNYMNLYLIDEYRTSKLYYKTEEPCKNLYAPKNGRIQKIHGVLSYKPIRTTPVGTPIKRINRTGYINRDKNATYNIRKIVGYVIKYGIRPLNYTRNNEVESLEKAYPGRKYEEYREKMKI